MIRNGRARARVDRYVRRMVKSAAYYSGLHRLVLYRYDYMFRPQHLCLLCDSLTETQSLRGPILEIGVAGGNTTVFLSKHLEDLSSDRTYYCIDTFDGFSQSDIDQERRRGKAEPSYGEVFRNYPEKYLVKTLENNRVTGVEVVRSDVADVDFSQFEDVSFCLIDVDLYAPVKMALEAVLPRMASGGIVVVDDCLPDHHFDGAHAAYLEVVKSQGLQVDIRGGKLGFIRVS